MTPCVWCGRTDGTHDPGCLGAARARRDDGIARAEAGALRSWSDEAYAALERYLRTHETMHCDEFARVLPSVPANLKAIGPLFLKAARAGLMSKSETYRPSVHSNMAPKVVWLSRVFRRDAA